GLVRTERRVAGRLVVRGQIRARAAEQVDRAETHLGGRRDVEAGRGRAVAGRVAVEARQEGRVAPGDRSGADGERSDLGIQGRRHRRRAFLDGPDADTAAVSARLPGPYAGER